MKSLADLPMLHRVAYVSAERMSVASRARRTAWKAVMFAFGLGGVLGVLLLISIAFQGAPI